MAKPKRTKTRAAKLLLLFLAFVFFTGCSPQQAPIKLTGFTMGTTYHITVIGSELDAKTLQNQIDQRLVALNQIFSTYIDDSDLSRLNQAPVSEWHSVNTELYTVMALSQRLAKSSQGAFDITVGPMVNAWGFGPDKTAEKPSDHQIQKLLGQIGYQNIQLLDGRVRKSKNVTIDLSAVAKGYAVDQIAVLLQDQGLQNFMVEIGGEVFVQGQSPRKTLWRIAIEEPGQGYAEVHRAVQLSAKAVATSGDYRNYYEVNGQRYSHTIDPTTGKPITHKLASVTVIADSCAEADVVATAINVMGADRGLVLAQQQGWAIYLLVKGDEGFNALYSDAFAPYME